MKWLDKAIQQSIDVENIVYDYHIATHKMCDPALILLWEPEKLIHCEIKYRLLFLDSLTAREEYDKFNKEISLPFQQKALNLFISVKVRIDIFLFQLHVRLNYFILTFVKIFYLIRINENR
jgi:hypothetical protein